MLAAHSTTLSPEEAFTALLGYARTHHRLPVRPGPRGHRRHREHPVITNHGTI
jgi:hypothetical protein